MTVELSGGPSFNVSICDPCKESFQETIPKALTQWKRGALYMREGKLFLADEGTYGGILRGSSDVKVERPPATPMPSHGKPLSVTELRTLKDHSTEKK